MTRPCCSESCPNNAIWFPVLLIWPDGYPKNKTRPAHMELELPQCDGCIQQLTIADLLNDETKAMIKTNFFESGMMNPDLEQVRLARKRIPDRKLEPFHQ